ncbi:MAG: ACT domain-containing protein [Candidatus Omnitrophica bacterium]|nr:ACT domain-containing protein [Candidatus Omnitrophota bacterium]
MKIQKQLSIFLDNRPGTLARLCRSLSRHGISIQAMTMADSIDHAVVRLVLSDPRKAVHLFEQAGLLVLEKEVVCLSVSNKAGALAAIAERLAKAGVNIEYAYCAAEEKQQKGLLVLRPSQAAKALRALKRGRN